ncbi:structural maintenance of chromosomes protein 4 [Phlebotomus argentipes]|uniref:structural maintenance of chromosomes protein 4 n=1 Tax=Phlebotomus argentipes TaxID=94469 RepID=UPI0028929D2D|nr:structural maintenance of chromosomes protein 4 [Phlebotomus argentipes]XP_059610952.1 structural maintenance of chromosomes protein 4 [Phlebotomus argentipes]
MSTEEEERAPDGMEVDFELQMSDDEEGGTRIGDIYIPPPVPPYCSAESKGPRLIITRIVNENFKSYAGETILGPFHHSFSAIVGPNGSGKSNVIDSMLFVFGYRAQKIRSKKLSVLLHKSAAFPNVNSCCVAVHFKEIVDKPDGSFEDLPNSSFVVSRSAFKDNSSYYQINERRVQFKEVSRLLKKHGIDLDHNRFLILQGEVESIAMMKPKVVNTETHKNECGLLEYLEDIVGTSRYKEPLVKINDKVVMFNEERTGKHNRCKLADRELKDLEEPYEKAIEYLKNENQLIRVKNKLLQKKIGDNVKEMIEDEEQKGEIVEELKKHTEKYEKLRDERVELEGVVKKDSQEYSNLVKKMKAQQKRHEKISCQYAEVQSLMQSTNARRKEAMAQVEKEKENLEKQKAMPEKTKKEIEECREKIESLSRDKVTQEDLLASNLAKLEDATRALNEQREPLENKMIGLQEAVNADRAALQVVESELKMVQYNEVMEARKYNSLKVAFEEAQQSLSEKEEKLQEVTRVLPKAREDLKSAEHELKESKLEETRLREKIQQLKTNVEDVTNNMQAAQSRDKVVNALMRQKQSGDIPGILGRLGDLGGIDAKYDVAISTCCGRLDNIVVDTVNTAQACIEYLKKHDTGRATFIALEKVDHLQQYCDQRQSYPENVPRLFDLIKVEDPRVSVAFYFALHDTLVATDLDQASRIAYGATRYRVVSLRGDVIELAGTMSGGGRSMMRGRMGQKVATKTSGATPKSRREIEGMQEMANNLQSELNNLQMHQGQLTRRIHELTTLIRTKESEEKKMLLDIKSFRQQLPHMREQMERQEVKKNETQSDPERVKALEKQMGSKKSKLEKSEEVAKEISDQILHINRKIKEITDSKVKSVKMKIEELSKNIEKLAAHVNKMMANLNSAGHTRQKLENKIKNLEEEIQEAADCIKKKSEERTELEQEGEKCKEEIEEMKKEIKEAQSKNVGATKRIAEIQKLEGQGKLEKVEIDDKHQAIEKRIKERKDMEHKWTNQMKSLELKEVPGETEMPPLKTYTERELESYTLNDIAYQITTMEDTLRNSKPNLSVIEEYNKKREVYLQRVMALEEVTKRRNDFQALYDDVKKKRHTEFMQGFTIIARKLKQMYQMITLGGDAELEIVDSMDPFSEGIMFHVRPPKKSWKIISNLSGGEKTLSSLALVFALHYYKPSPLYVMDEIDAALDFKNVSIVAHYIKERTKNAQFIIISLRSNMFELSNHLVGIYKINDCTGSITIANVERPVDAEEENAENNELQLL